MDVVSATVLVRRDRREIDVDMSSWLDVKRAEAVRVEVDWWVESAEGAKANTPVAGRRRARTAESFTMVDVM